MNPALTHVAFGVQDLDRTIAFYRKHVRLHVVHEREEHGTRVVWLGAFGAAHRHASTTIAPTRAKGLICMGRIRHLFSSPRWDAGVRRTPGGGALG